MEQERIISFDEDLREAVETLRRGGVILYPTDTVWGLGCDATCSEAVRRIYEIKRRADSKALITLVGDVTDLYRYVSDVPDIALSLIELSAKPLTIVYDKGVNLAPELLSADGSVGIRVSRERFSSQLCRKLRRPVVSTSANRSGEATPAIFDEISPEIRAAVDYVVSYRQDDRRQAVPSSVIKLGSDSTVKIIRQ
ncbi:MAG: threonylcarbamoyl-AMP synthase [Muribaculaceae bacterium]|nr:threonylcarbamoyl-AMP synthase [Muribaculaceae bacterium]